VTREAPRDGRGLVERKTDGAQRGHHTGSARFTALIRAVPNGDAGGGVTDGGKTVL
jgi:hypothetical protein